MPAVSTVATQALLLSAIVAAAPSGSKLSEHKLKLRQLLARDDGWEGDDDGNVAIRVSDKQVNWGTTSIGDVIGDAKDACSDISCGSNGQDVEADTDVIVRYWTYGRSVGIHADGTFVRDGAGTNDNLFEIAKAALEEMEEIHEKNWTDWFGCAGSDCDSMSPESLPLL